MNKITAYEQLIAQQLEQLPVPDMADLVWESIVPELDQIPAAPDHQKPFYKGKFWLGICVVFVAVVLVWILSSQRHHTPAGEASPELVPPAEYKKNIADSARNEVEVPVPISPAPTIKLNSDTITAIPTAIPVIADTLQQFIPPAADISSPDSVVQVPVDSLQSTPVKKPKGVKGITPGDYKIYGAKKDSAKKRN